jgi:hypothetical protein
MGKRMERRWGPRIEVDLPVRLGLAQGRVIPARMRNASVSGALIECSEELPVFTPLRIEIPATGNRVPQPIEVTARVVRAEHPCIGVEWRDFEPQVIERMLLNHG